MYFRKTSLKSMFSVSEAIEGAVGTTQTNFLDPLQDMTYRDIFKNAVAQQARDAGFGSRDQNTTTLSSFSSTLSMDGTVAKNEFSR